MAQVTKETIKMVRAQHARGNHANLTINEEEQLLHAWEEYQRFLKIQEVLRPHVAEFIGRGHGDGGEWSYSRVMSLTLEEAEHILQERQNALDALGKKR